jgi:hypothetical protein
MAHQFEVRHACNGFVWPSAFRKDKTTLGFRVLKLKTSPELTPKKSVVLYRRAYRLCKWRLPHHSAIVAQCRLVSAVAPRLLPHGYACLLSAIVAQCRLVSAVAPSSIRLRPHAYACLLPHSRASICIDRQYSPRGCVDKMFHDSLASSIMFLLHVFV